MSPCELLSRSHPRRARFPESRVSIHLDIVAKPSLRGTVNRPLGLLGLCRKVS